MKTWETEIVERFLTGNSKLWVVSDRDALIRNEKVTGALLEKGFELLTFEDPLSFRYRYEAGIRAAWDRGEPARLVVVFDPDAEGFNRLPADVLAKAEQVDLSFIDLFPTLNSTALKELSPSLFSKLFLAGAGAGAVKGLRDTQDFVLRTCFGFDLTVLQSEAELLRLLIKFHREGRHLPPGLFLHVYEVLGRNPKLKLWPLKELLTDKEAFWKFLQERWPRFLREELGMMGEGEVSQLAAPLLPFAHEDVRVYVESLFREGILKPVTQELLGLPSPAPWWTIGVKRESELLSGEKLKEQGVLLAKAIPELTATFQDWQLFLARYNAYVQELFSLELGKPFREVFWTALWPQVDKAFKAWLDVHYNSLHTLPPSPPVVTHHVPKYLLKRVQAGRKVALLVLDGLAASQWTLLGKLLREDLAKGPKLSIEENVILTWVPSITPIGRQAVFSGQIPLLFASTVDRTDKDLSHWFKFWRKEASLPDSQISHLEFHGNDTEVAEILTAIKAAPRVFGMTLFTPDKVMHGATMGWPQMFTDLKVWAQEGILGKICSALLEEGYELYITSDHGNLEALGTGNFSEGVLVDKAGERIRKYPNAVLRDKTLQTLGEKAVPLNFKGLPEDYFALVATGRGAFSTPGAKVICHGGLSVDELFVPWVKLEVNTL